MSWSLLQFSLINTLSDKVLVLTIQFSYSFKTKAAFNFTGFLNDIPQTHSFSLLLFCFPQESSGADTEGGWGCIPPTSTQRIFLAISRSCNALWIDVKRAPEQQASCIVVPSAHHKVQFTFQPGRCSSCFNAWVEGRLSKDACRRLMKAYVGGL